MAFKTLLLCTTLMFDYFALSQNDSVIYNNAVRMPDGIYLSYEDFRYDQPIKIENIVSTIDKNQLEFVGKVMFEETLQFRRNDSIIKTSTRAAWGYFQNNALFVNYRGDFYRVPVFGSISYLVAKVITTSPGFYDPRFGMPVGTTNSAEIREFLINFYDGKVVEFTASKVDELFARDVELFAEYSKLSRRKQKQEVYRFIRKYNEKHPIFFLK